MTAQHNPRADVVARPANVHNLDAPAHPESPSGREVARSRPRSLIAATGRLMLQITLPAVALAGAVAVYSHLKATKPDVPRRQAQETTYAVQVVPVRIGSVRPVLTLYGNTTAGRQVELRSLVAGRVIETGVGLREGAVVAHGDVLLRVDKFDYEVALKELHAQHAETKAKLAEMRASLATERGNLQFAQAQLRLAKADLERAAPLVRSGTVSERTVDDRRLIVFQREQAAKQAENTIAVWQARIAQQEAVLERYANSIAKAERRLEETVLKAPFDAYVSGVSAQVGRMLSANDSVATLIDRDWIEVRFTLANDQFGRLLAEGGDPVGREMEVQWNVGAQTLRYPAVIERVGARVAATSGGVEVHARLKSPRNPVPIRPGAFVTVKLDGAQLDNVARVPSPAVYDNARVFIVVDGRLKARTVQVVGIAGDELVVSGELKDGDRVVATRLSMPGDGIRVEEQRRNGS